MRSTAIVTGASRGIGKACAIALAANGYEVVITARTVRRGDDAPDPEGIIAGSLPGSLEETAEEIAAVGGRAHLIPFDLLDVTQVSATAEACLHALGHVDVLINNAIFTGPGNHHRFLDVETTAIDNRIIGNLTSQLHFTQPIARAMVARGKGVILNMTSAAAYLPPFAKPGEGGWGLTYAISKGGFHRIAPQLSYEYGSDGLIALNVQPGVVATERAIAVGGPLSRIAEVGATPAVVAAAVVHVANHAAAYDTNRTVQLQNVAVELGLIDEIKTFS